LLKSVLQRSLLKSLMAAGPAVSTSPGVRMPVAADDSGRRPLRSVPHNTLAVSEVNVTDAGHTEAREPVSERR